MLETRSYLREGPLWRPWPATFVLMGVLAVAFFAQAAVGFYLPEFYGRVINRYLTLNGRCFGHGWLWQLVTFQFLHSGLWHLLFNLLGIYFFGRLVEERLGRGAFWRFYLISGAVGGLCQGLLGLVFPAYFGGSLVGASAGVYALVLAAAVLEPDGVVLLFFVLPVRLKWFAAFAAGLALFYVVVPLEPGIGHAAHLGGMIGGLAYLRWPALAEALRGARLPRPGRFRPRELLRIPAGKGGRWSRSGPAPGEELSPTEFISREVDPILDKISAHGIHSLTPRERQILERARAKMEHRTRDG